MRHTGRITSWNDDRGFGFIEPKDGSERVFLHISALNGGRIRPRDGDEVGYQLGSDERNRPRATAARLHRGAEFSAGLFRLSFAVLFLGAVALGVLLKRVEPWVLWTYFGVSLIAWIAYWQDKRRAQSGKWRIPEETLHLWEILGGWPGALAAQQLLRHKNRKLSFQVVFWLIVLLHLGFWGWHFRESPFVAGILSLVQQVSLH